MVKYNDYTQTIILFNRFAHDKAYQGDRQLLSFAVAEILSNLLEHWLSANPSATGWRIGEYCDSGILMCVVAHHEKAGLDLHTGIHKTGFYLEITVAKPENVAAMPGSFWDQYFALSNMCEIVDMVEDITELKQIGIRLFEVCWPFDTYSIADVFTNGATVFKSLVEFNELLAAIEPG